MVWDNECLANQKFSSLQPPTPDAPATFLPYCAEWVINTTDKVWLPTRTPKQVTEALHEHFYAEWESTSNGKYFRGMKVLEGLVAATKTAFPDLKLEVSPERGSAVVFNDCFDNGDEDGRSLHAGLAPKDAATVKYAINGWIRAEPVAHMNAGSLFS